MDRAGGAPARSSCPAPGPPGSPLRSGRRRPGGPAVPSSPDGRVLGDPTLVGTAEALLPVPRGDEGFDLGGVVGGSGPEVPDPAGPLRPALAAGPDRLVRGVRLGRWTATGVPRPCPRCGCRDSGVRRPALRAYSWPVACAVPAAGRVRRDPEWKRPQVRRRPPRPGRPPSIDRWVRSRRRTRPASAAAAAPRRGAGRARWRPAPRTPRRPRPPAGCPAPPGPGPR